MNETSSTLSLTICNVRQLTPQIRAYRFRASDGGELPLVTAGSHISIPVRLAEGTPAFHDYFICSNSHQREFYEIAVSYEKNGRGGSQYIADNFCEEMQLECRFPVSRFQVHADASPAILLAGGIGISPMMSIANTLSLRGRRFTLHYSGHEVDMAFVQELQDRFPRNVIFYHEGKEPRLDLMHILGHASANTFFYACAPQAMLVEIETSLRSVGIAKDRIQIESLSSPDQQQNASLTLELTYSNKILQINPTQSLLNAVREAGVDVDYDCCVGDCGSCAVKIVNGEADHRDHVLSDAQKAQGYICLCVSRAKGDKLVIAL